MTIRSAVPGDLPFLTANDRHIDPTELERVIAAGRVLLAEVSKPVGWLRWGLFWDNLPMCNLLYVLEPYRGAGTGSALMAEWERRMAAAGYRLALTSTQVDETAQHFYRRLGYRDGGVLLLPGEVTELFLWKELV